MYQLRFITNDMHEVKDTPIASRQLAQAAFDVYAGQASETILCVELWQLVGGCSRCLDAYYFLTLADSFAIMAEGEADEPIDYIGSNDPEFDAACAEFYRTSNYT